jgi:hypothetical protein
MVDQQKASLVLALCLVAGCGSTQGSAESGTDSNDSDSQGTSSTTGGSEGEAARGNVAFELRGCTNYDGAVGPDTAATSAVKSSQLPASDGTELGRRIEDGQEDAVVQCSITAGMPHLVEARIQGLQAHPSAQFMESVGITIQEGWIYGTADGAAGEALITIQTGGVTYSTPQGSPCSLSLESAEADNQFRVEAGSIYARFECPELVDPPTTGCVATGAFVFERCDED